MTKIPNWIAVILGTILGAIGCALYFQFATPPEWGQNFVNLIVSGGCGGLANALLLGTNRLGMPRFVKTDEKWEWEAGFLSDLFIGIIGAIASLVFALAILNDSFFGEVQGKPSQISIPSWARIIAFGALAGFAARQLLPNLSKRMSDMIAKQVQEKVDENSEVVDKKQRNNELNVALALQAAETLRNAATQIPFATAMGTATHMEQIRILAEQYVAIGIADDGTRKAERMKQAKEMAHFSVQNGIDSEAIFNAIRSSPNKGLVVPLATLIAAEPKAGDANRLLEAYSLCFGTAAIRNESKFILYRVLLALAALNEWKLLSATEKESARKIARDCLDIPDASLQRRAQAVLDLLDE